LTTIEETLTKLIEMKLVSMAQAVRELMDTAPGHQLSFDEKLGLVVDREWTDRDNRRLSRRLKDAKLATRASLDNARASGVYASLLGKLSRVDVLVLDDFLLNPMADVERRDLLEVIEDRYDKSSTVIATQMPTKTWHDGLGDPTIADAICDRLVHNAHVLKLGGPSIRKKKALEPQTQPA
jgi:hypothetical protein